MTAAAIVTGGAGALGQAIGRRLREAGEVLLVDLEEAALRDVAGRLRAAHLAVDLVAPARLALGLRAQMPAGSAIVNVASRAALGSFGQANYSAAKAGLIGLTRALAIRWAPDVRVNVIAPGLVDTPMTAGMPEKVLSKLVARVPLGRMAEPAEIAETIAFLASPAASYVTGQILLACGGRSIAP